MYLLDEEGDELRSGAHVSSEQRVAAAIRGVDADAAAHDDCAEHREARHVEPHRSDSGPNATKEMHHFALSECN